MGTVLEFADLCVDETALQKFFQTYGELGNIAYLVVKAVFLFIYVCMYELTA